MLWIALHLPELSLEALCATLPAADAARPVALLQQHHIGAVNACAAQQGVRAGMKRATGLALCAELLLAEADPARDAAALRAVAHVALAFTPSVTRHDARTVLLEVQASLRLFGGLQALHQRLQDALAPLGHRVQIAAAPTARGAALLAQWQPLPACELVLGLHGRQLPALQALLAQAPLALLQAAHAHGAALQGMGLQTVADLLAQPRAGLARRFGQALLDELDRALGHAPDPRRWLRLPEFFETRLELPARAEHADQLLHAAVLLLCRLVAWARARHVRVAAFTLRMLHERQRQVLAEPTALTLALAEPTQDAAHLQALLRERLAQCRLAAPTLELQLLCRDVVAGHAPSGELFATPTAQAEGVLRLLERLRARLGDAQVQRLLPVADHRPERASLCVPASAATPAAAAQVAGGMGTVVDVAALLAAARACELPLHRPAWLLPEPLPLAEREGLPLLQGRALQVLSGPERIETGWWDGEPVARDYYIALAGDGALVWVWRNRLPMPEGAANWFLQGLFA